MMRLHVSPALYHLLRLKEVKPLLLLVQRASVSGQQAGVEHIALWSRGPVCTGLAAGCLTRLSPDLHATLDLWRKLLLVWIL